MKQILYMFAMIMATIAVAAQPSLPDQKRHTNHQPEQSAGHQQVLVKKYSAKARQQSTQSGIPVNEDILPDAAVKMPVKQVRKLATIPATVFTKEQLLAYASALERNLMIRAAEKEKHWLDSISEHKKGFQQHNAAAGTWYRNEPMKALLLQLRTARQHGESILAWNNLGAMLHMAGFPHKAIPVLNYCLSQKPDHTVVLNNLGQCYLKLGDIPSAKEFLQRSLAVAPFNPDAAHSMGMISMYEKNPAAARSYFERALQIAQRAGTIAQYIRAGGKVNLGDLRQTKYRWSGKSQKNYFDDLALEQFDIDFFPRTLADVNSFRKKTAEYIASVDDEINYWSGSVTASLSESEQRYYRHTNRSVYSHIADALLEELHKEFHPAFLALPFDHADAAVLQQTGMAIQYETEQVDKTVTAPAGSDSETEEAYRRLRCSKKTDIYNKYLPKYNGVIEKRYKLLKSRWKSYINQLIVIVALDPTPGNRKMAYSTMTGYFSMLRGIVGNTLLPDFPLDCETTMTSEEATAVLQSRRQLDIDCPEIFELEGELFGVNMELNCDGLKIDAGMETEPIGAGYEKNFRTGMSTLWFGIGMEGALEFDNKVLGEGKMNNQFFISFDNHNQFADAGYRGQSVFEGKGDNGIDFTYSFAINAGFDASMETSGVFKGAETWFE